MITPIEHGDGCVVAVRAQPGARRNGIVGEHNGALRVAVTAPPDKSRANDAIGEVLAAALGLRRGDVQLISGPTSRDKKFALRGVTPQVALERIQAILANE